MHLLRRTLLPCLFLAFAAAGFAQAVHWENGDSTMGNVVQLVFEDCEPEDDPQLPTIPNTTFTVAGRSTSINMVNTSVTRTLTLTYYVQSRRGGPLQIPAFTVKTNKGPIKVAAFNGAAPAATSDSFASAKLTPDRTSVWAGEVFGFKYEITAATRYNPQFGPSLSIDWNPAPAVVEEWTKPAGGEAVIGGQRSVVISTTTRGYLKTPGTVKMEPAHELIQVQTGAVGFGLFSQARMEPITVTSDAPTIEVKPLPSAPPAFSGAVGQFQLTSKIVPKEAAVGDPITWTLELTGTGNWPDLAGLPAREVSKDFQVVQPKAKRTSAEGKLFDSTLTEDVVLVPTKPGSYTLGPVAFTFFNPRTGAYETLRTETTTVNVTATAAPNAPASAGTSSGSTSTESGSVAPAPRTPPKSAAAPAPIPGDTVAGAGHASLPLTTTTLVRAALVSLAAVLGWWLYLAWRHAVRHDPLRPRREAQQRLAHLLAQLRTASPSAATALVLEWQRQSAVLWGIARAVPTAADFERAATQSGRSPVLAADWARLWTDSERAIYAASGRLPDDWVPRAETALGEFKLAPFNPARLFLPRHLLAFAAALALAVLVLPHPAHAAESKSPEVLYRAGEFGAAEAAWREAISTDATNWVAHHNLALALVQQDKNTEAAAHATVAFVQHPRSDAVRRTLVWTADKAGTISPTLQRFVTNDALGAFAALASPAQWQRALLAAIVGLAAALGWLLWTAYVSRSRLQLWLGVALFGISLVGGLLAIAGCVSYGRAADRRAVIAAQNTVLRSIPTEADTTQKTSVLQAGSIAVVDRTFLGWNHLVFPTGQTGWVRKEDVVGIWR
jgi:hypothetical protein